MTRDDKNYSKDICFTPRLPTPGGLASDKDIKASPYLIKALREREWIDKAHTDGMTNNG